MSKPSLSSVIHMRDFVDDIRDDPARENIPNYIEILSDINVFAENSFYCPDIAVDPIRTRIHAYLTRQERDLYVPNAFFYADGRFSTALSVDGSLEIDIQVLSLTRHPGDVSDFDEYRRHLPEKWCPMVTIVGSVPPLTDNSPDPSESRHFVIETSVYDTSKAALVHFSVVCYFENTKRWQNVNLPPPGASLCITAKVAGRNTTTNFLALRVLDLAYLPRSGPATATATPTATPTSKRSYRWEGRAPSTPSKRPRTSEAATAPASIPPPTTRIGAEPLPTDDMTQLSSTHTPASYTASSDETPLSSALSLDGGPRPHRNRHPPKRYVEPE